MKRWQAVALVAVLGLELGGAFLTFQAWQAHRAHMLTETELLTNHGATLDRNRDAAPNAQTGQAVSGDMAAMRDAGTRPGSTMCDLLTGAAPIWTVKDCVADEKGAWALTVDAPVKSANGSRCPRIAASLRRASANGTIASMPLPLDRVSCDEDGGNAKNADVEDLKVHSIKDLDGDGIPEAFVQRDMEQAYYDPELGFLATERNGRVSYYPHTKGLPLSDVSDVDGDGFVDLSYRYILDGGYDVGCGAPQPYEYTASLVAYGNATGRFDFHDERAIDVLRTECPYAPKDPTESFFCGLVWAEGTLKDLNEADRRCVESARQEPAPDPNEGCTPSAERDECSQYGVLRNLLKVPIPLRLREPPNSAAGMGAADAGL